MYRLCWFLWLILNYQCDVIEGGVVRGFVVCNFAEYSLALQTEVNNRAAIEVNNPEGIDYNIV